MCSLIEHIERDQRAREADNCPHLSISGDEGPMSELGRWPVRWKCDSCGAVWDERTSAQRGRMFEDHKIIPPRRRYAVSSSRLVFIKPSERDEMEAADRQFRESEEGRQRCFLHRPA